MSGTGELHLGNALAGGGDKIIEKLRLSVIDFGKQHNVSLVVDDLDDRNQNYLRFKVTGTAFLMASVSKLFNDQFNAIVKGDKTGCRILVPYSERAKREFRESSENYDSNRILTTSEAATQMGYIAGLLFLCYIVIIYIQACIQR